MKITLCLIFLLLSGCAQSKIKENEEEDVVLEIEDLPMFFSAVERVWPSEIYGVTQFVDHNGEKWDIIYVKDKSDYSSTDKGHDE